MRWSILDKLIRKGQLTVIAANGEQRQFGQGQPSVAVEFLDPRCFGDILRNPPMNFAQTYVEGRWRPAQGSDLYAVLRLLRLNFEQSQTRGNWSLLTQSVQAFLNSWNSVVASRRNVAHHYDQDETLFRACLDRDMHYSCAYFEDPATDLESAQHAKCEHIARKLRLQPGQRVLDIGCRLGQFGAASGRASSGSCDRLNLVCRATASCLGPSLRARFGRQGGFSATGLPAA
jgi:cyclopropane-fatty-acyl-phospholipid synthase